MVSIVVVLLSQLCGFVSALDNIWVEQRWP